MQNGLPYHNCNSRCVADEDCAVRYGRGTEAACSSNPVYALETPGLINLLRPLPWLVPNWQCAKLGDLRQGRTRQHAFYYATDISTLGSGHGW